LNEFLNKLNWYDKTVSEIYTGTVYINTSEPCGE
jgi:hypothetical protein